MESYFLENAKEDICLIYIGHGEPEGWPLNGRRHQTTLTYTKLNLILVHHEGNLILVNHCCHAGAAEKSLKSHQGDSLLLAAMPEEFAGTPHKFLKTIFRGWKARTYFCIDDAHTTEGHRPVVIGNLKLQTLMYPEKR